MNNIVKALSQSNTSDSITKGKGMMLLLVLVYSGNSQVVLKSFDQIFAQWLVAYFMQNHPVGIWH